MMPLRRAVFLWWVTSAVGAFAVASPLLAWFDVLRAVPFHSVASDVGLLFDRLFTGATRAQTLPALPLFEATLWQVIVWRLVLLVPTALTMGVVTRPAEPPHVLVPSDRGLLRTLTRLPQFFGVTVVIQTSALFGGGFGLSYALSRLLAAEARVLDVLVGAGLGMLSLLFVAASLTTLEAARLSLFRRSRQLQRPNGLSCILDGLDVLRRQGWRLIGTVVGFWALGVGVCAVLSGVATYIATLLPSGFGSLITWAVTQVGVGANLAFRIACWRRVWRSGVNL